MAKRSDKVVELPTPTPAWKQAFSDFATDTAFSITLSRAQVRIIRQIVADESSGHTWTRRHVAQYVAVDSLESKGLVLWEMVSRRGARNLRLSPAGLIAAQLIARTSAARESIEEANLDEAAA